MSGSYEENGTGPSQEQTKKYDEMQLQYNRTLALGWAIAGIPSSPDHEKYLKMKEHEKYLKTKEQRTESSADLCKISLGQGRQNNSGDVQYRSAQIFDETIADLRPVRVIEDSACRVNFITPSLVNFCNLIVEPAELVKIVTLMGEFISDRGARVQWIGRGENKGSDFCYISPKNVGLGILMLVGTQFLNNHPDVFHLAEESEPGFLNVQTKVKEAEQVQIQANEELANKQSAELETSKKRKKLSKQEEEWQRYRPTGSTSRNSRSQDTSCCDSYTEIKGRQEKCTERRMEEVAKARRLIRLPGTQVPGNSSSSVASALTDATSLELEHRELENEKSDSYRMPFLSITVLKTNTSLMVSSEDRIAASLREMVEAILEAAFNQGKRFKSIDALRNHLKEFFAEGFITTNSEVILDCYLRQQAARDEHQPSSPPLSDRSQVGEPETSPEADDCLEKSDTSIPEFSSDKNNTLLAFYDPQLNRFNLISARTCKGDVSYISTKCTDGRCFPIQNGEIILPWVYPGKKELSRTRFRLIHPDKLPPSCDSALAENHGKDDKEDIEEMEEPAMDPQSNATGA
ncbi:hypothetical protein B7463_g4219, partial [Scytalidium lignicola]